MVMDVGDLRKKKTGLDKNLIGQLSPRCEQLNYDQYFLYLDNLLY